MVISRWWCGVALVRLISLLRVCPCIHSVQACYCCCCAAAIANYRQQQTDWLSTNRSARAVSCSSGDTWCAVLMQSAYRDRKRSLCGHVWQRAPSANVTAICDAMRWRCWCGTIWTRRLRTDLTRCSWCFLVVIYRQGKHVLHMLATKRLKRKEVILLE